MPRNWTALSATIRVSVVFGEDTQSLVPKAIVTRDARMKPEKALFKPGGFIYEVAVRPFTMLHPDVPEAQRGTVAALAHPSVIAHLKRIGVDAVELMPIVAWIDERHLPPLGLTNGWGYNPVTFMALDPRLVPGGMAELRDTVATLHAEGIARHPRPRLQPYRRKRPLRRDALAARPRQSLLLPPSADGRPGRTRQRHRLPATRSPAITPIFASLSSTASAISCSPPASTASASISAPILGRDANGFEATPER